MGKVIYAKARFRWIARKKKDKKKEVIELSENMVIKNDRK